MKIIFFLSIRKNETIIFGGKTKENKGKNCALSLFWNFDGDCQYPLLQTAANTFSGLVLSNYPYFWQQFEVTNF